MGSRSAPRRASSDPLRKMFGSDPGGTGPEWWSWLAFSMLGLLLVAFGYLGLRPGGDGPIWVWFYGRFHLSKAALGLLVVGVLWCALRAPFLQRRRGQALVCLVLVVGLAPWPLPYPSSHEGHPSSVAFRLPVDGEWIVTQGGEGRDVNLLSLLTHDQRWGLHLVKEGPVPGASDPSEPRRFPSWGQPVLAAAAGVVVRVRDGLPDPDRLDLKRDESVPFHGNLVVLQVAEGQFLFTTQLLAGSIEVAEGQPVAAGARLGRVGCSGQLRITIEPHVAVHLQDTPDDLWGEGVPWNLSDFQVDGHRVERGLPRGGGSRGRLGGEKVRQATPAD